jgi:tetratricopeptide (TPR) repeat protein
MSEARTILGARSGLVNALGVGIVTLVVVVAAVYLSYGWLTGQSMISPGPMAGDQQAAEGMARVERGEGAQASPLLEQARRRKHGDEVDRALAASYVLQGRTDLAIASLKQALAMKPVDAELWHLLGSLELQSGDPAAIDSLAKAAGLSKSWDFWRDLGEAQAASGQPAKSVRSLAKAWSWAPAGPLRAEIAVRIADTEWASGRRADAHSWYVRALSDAPRDPAARKGASSTGIMR